MAIRMIQMATIRVKSPVLKGDLVLQWEGRKISLVNPGKMEEYEWKYLQSRGLYGKYGHSLDVNDCFFTDAVIAISVVVGADNCIIDPQGEQQLKKEKSEEDSNPIPKGAAS